MNRALLCLLAACGARLPPLPSQGGPTWLELDSPHFKMWTDASPERGRELVQQMEHFRSIVYGVAFPDVPPGGVSFVIAFRDHGESDEFMRRHHPAVTFSPEKNPIDQPTIVMASDEESIRNQDVPHELTHAVTDSAVHDQPRWYAEGIATYFQTIALDTKTATVAVGNPPAIVGMARTHDLRSVDYMVHCQKQSCTDDPMFYATAWVLYAQLRNQHPDQLAKLEKLIGRTPPDEAWKQVFPDHPLARYHWELRDWLFNGNLKIFKYTIALQQWPVTERRLSDAEVHTARAFANMIAHGDRVAGEVAAALALDPTNVFARAIEAMLNHKPPTVEIARAMVAAHADDWLAWEALVGALKPGPEAEAARVKMCALVVQNPELASYDRCKPKESPPQPAPAP